MSSYRNHRVLVASLFLPLTAVRGPDRSESATPIATAPTVHRLLSTLSQPASPVKSAAAGPLKSIVDDLKDKSTPASSPAPQSENPFFTSLSSAAAALVSSHTPPTSRKHHTTHTDHAHSSQRLARKSSRSSSRYRASLDSGGSHSHPPIFVHPTDDWHVQSNPHCNGGLKNAIDSVGDRMKRKLWVGALGTQTNGYDDALRANIDNKMRTEANSVPVWIPDAEFEKCYDEFCHQVLWPCLHYAIPDAPKVKSFYESAAWTQYVAVNKKFADVIVANYEEGDIIWVNDYHLMLVPALLRARLPNAAIGFFLHVAFPSSEIFRCLSVRSELLQGILGADLVGFQTANFARHFRQTVSRILSLEALPKGIQTLSGMGVLGESMGTGRFVDVAVTPMGIDVSALNVKRREPEVKEWITLLKQRYQGMKMIVGRDKLDEVQGVRQKLLAFEQFLIKHPEFRQKVVLIQVALSTTSENEAQGGVADLVARINSDARFASLTYQPPVVFLHTSDLTFSQYLALLSVADAFLVTSLREGMALRTHEFVVCQEGRSRPLILSEFTGSYSYSGFRSCLPVNPWDSRGTADAIYTALTMSDEEALSRWTDLHNHVVTQTAQAFVTGFLTKCLRCHLEHERQVLDVSVSAGSGEVGVGTLDVPRVLPRYRHSRRRLLLVDLEGTLWTTFDPRAAVEAMKTLQGESEREEERGGKEEEDGRVVHRDDGASGDDETAKSAITVPKDVVDVLKTLSDDDRNEVWVLSGLQIEGALENLVKELPNIGVCAENGCFVKPRSTRQKQEAWINMVKNFNLSWKTSCLEILQYFTERTPGSFIEEREASIVWRFWTGPADDSGRQWARRQAAEAQNHIFDSLGERYGLRIIPGKNSFLVLPNNISRSSAVGSILSPGGPLHSPIDSASRSPWFFSTSSSATSFDLGEDDGSRLAEDIDFVLAVSADEKLLRRLNELEYAETVSTGEGPGGTDARWRLESVEVVKVLWQFAKAK